MFLDPLIIVQLGNLRIRSRRILDGIFSGYHNTPLRGTSQEFSEHRAYHPGDDLKTLDWKAFGRTDRLVTKQFEEETNVGGWILIDDSASMNYSAPGRPSKLEYAKTMTAALGTLMQFQNDAVGLITSQHVLPPRCHKGHLDQMMDCLEELKGEGIWNLPSQIQKMNLNRRKRTFVFVFSDLMENEADMIKGIQFLSSRKNEVIVFQILDPNELTLPMDGLLVFDDLETREKVKTDPAAIRVQYQKIVQRTLDGFNQIFHSHAIDYHLLKTDMPFEKGLGTFLSIRGQYL